MSKIFISYSRRDSRAAQRVYLDLKKAGHVPWIDTEDLLPGDWIDDRIYEAIRSSDYFLALISRQSLDGRGYVLREIRIAMDLLVEMPFGERFLIPVRLDDCRPRDRTLSKIQWLDLFEDYDSGFKRLVRVIGLGSDANVKSYAKAGIAAPRGLATWGYDRMFSYFEDELWPEAINRARRDWQNVDALERDREVIERAREKARAFAKTHGVFDAWCRYENERQRTGPTDVD